MIEIDPHKCNNLRNLFSENNPSFLIETVLQGVLGRAYVDNAENPNVAMLAYADVLAIGGNADHSAARLLLQQIPAEKGILPLPEKWSKVLKGFFEERLVNITRYDFSHDSLNEDYLHDILQSVPAGYELRSIDLSLASMIAGESAPISEDHVRNFGSPEQFMEKGFGYCLMHDQNIVSGASTYAICNEGIEIQVNTNEAYQGKGLARIVSAALIVESLRRGLVPHWDAANPTSAQLAERLGYTPLGQYQMHLVLP